MMNVMMWLVVRLLIWWFDDDTCWIM